MKFIRPLLGSEIDAVISSLTLKGFSGRIVRQSDSVDPNFMIDLIHFIITKSSFNVYNAFYCKPEDKTGQKIPHGCLKYL